jgi:hypothetical protein
MLGLKTSKTVGRRCRYWHSWPLGHRPLAKKRQKKLPGVLSAAVQPESLRMLQREGAAVLERYASSRSPPDHLLYHILKIVPVCGGGSDFMVDGSTCGRAGRRFRRMSFVFFAGGSEEEREDSLLVVVRALQWFAGVCLVPLG